VRPPWPAGRQSDPQPADILLGEAGYRWPWEGKPQVSPYRCGRRLRGFAPL